MNKKLLSAFLFAGLLSNVSAQSPWLLDPSWSTDGKTMIDYGFQDNLTCVTVNPNNLTVLTGGTAISSTTFGGNLLISRYLPDGSLDPTFDGDGNLILTGFTESYAYDIHLLSDGKILVAGASANPQYQFSMLLMRLNADGSYDTSFGTNGLVQTDLAPADEFAYSMAIQADNKIVLAGSAGDVNYNNMPALVRYNEDGTLDTSFGTNGIVTLPVTQIDNDFSKVMIQADGKIVAAGHWDQGLTDGGQQNFDILLARFETTGQADLSFGTSGVVITPVSFQYTEEAYGLAITTEGEFLVSGFTLAQDLSQNIVLLKFTNSGALQTAFGNNGKVIFDRTTGDVAYDMMLQGDQILIAGAIGNNIDELDFLLARFNSDGEPDSSFGTNSVIRTDIQAGFDEANAITTLPDGRILLAGKGNNGVQNDAVTVRYTRDGLPIGMIDLSEKIAIQLYPNPVQAGSPLQIKLSGNQTGLKHVSIYTIQGTCVWKQAIQSTNSTETSILQLELPTNLSSGMYLLQVDEDNTHPQSIRLGVVN